MDGSGRSRGFRQSRRSRSQRDRERRRRRADLVERRASSPSSESEREVGRGIGTGVTDGVECVAGTAGNRHRPPRRRKRESISCEEDIIDGFAIASFISLEALEFDCSLKPPELATLLIGRGSKRKRGPEDIGPVSGPEECDPLSYSHSCQDRTKKKKKREVVRTYLLEAGYICDTESESGDKASDNDVDPMFTVCTRRVLRSDPASTGSSGSKGTTTVSSFCSHPWLCVTPRVSGLQRSQEKSVELSQPDSLCTTTPSSSSSALHIPTAYPFCTPATLPGSLNGDRCLQLPNTASSPRPKHKPLLTFSRAPLSRYSMDVGNRSSTLAKSSSSVSSSSTLRPPTVSTNLMLSLNAGSSFPRALQSHPSSGAVFNLSPSLPPPPPLLQVPSQPATGTTSSNPAAFREQDLLRQELNSRFLTSLNVENEGVDSSVGKPANRSSESGGPSASSSGPVTSASGSQAQSSIPQLAFQFHQHNHQHQHTHTHQHFTPFLPPTATAPPLFDKYPGKMEGLYRHNFFTQYPSTVSEIQPVLPSTGPFSSLRGAFQPKVTSPEMTTRLGPMPHHIQPNDPRLTDSFRNSLRVNKPGKWCAMHVRVAWMILRHQEKVKADPHKLDLCNDLLSRVPGAGGLSRIAGLGTGGLPSAHDLARPSSLFTATDPFGRSLPFSPIGALGSGAFGGLGSPTLVARSVFGHKEPPRGTVGGLVNSHDPWNRLPCAPPFPSAPSWVPGGDKRERREQAKEAEKKETFRIKDEKDQDCLVYGRRSVRMSPVSSIKLSSNKAITHSNGLRQAVGEVEDPSEKEPPQASSRDTHRDLERDTKESSSFAPRAPIPVASSVVERTCSSSSSAPRTPALPICLASSPLDLYPRKQPLPLTTPQSESSCPYQKENSCPIPPPASVSHLPQDKKPDVSPTPILKHATSHPPLRHMPLVKVKEEKKEELEPIPISLPLPHVPHRSYERPSSCHHPSAPSSSHLSLGPSTSVPLLPPNQHPPHHPLTLSLPPRATAAIEAYLGRATADRFSPHLHVPSQAHSQPPHIYPWDPWRESRREALALRSDPHLALRSDPHLALRSDPHLSLRSDPHLARLFQHQQAQRFFDAERVAAVAAAVATSPHLPPPPSASSSSSVRREFGLSHHHHQENPSQAVGCSGSGILDEEQRPHILREEFDRTRYYGMHPHPHLSNPHVTSSSHLDQLHAGLLSHHHPAGASAPSPHNPSLYSRLGPLLPHSHPHNVTSGLLSKTPSGLMGTLSVGVPPPLISSVTSSRSSTPPRSSRMGGAPELAMLRTRKERESR